MRIHLDSSKMKVKKFFRVYAAAFSSINLYCNHNTSNIMATALMQGSNTLICGYQLIHHTLAV